jgi:hypothetical protein
LDKTIRDFQKLKVYAWETEVISPKDTTSVPFHQIPSIVEYVWRNEGLNFPPKVLPLPKMIKKVCADGTRLEVRFQEVTKTWIILHELSHSMTCTFDHFSNVHGAQYLGIYLQLLGRYLKLDVQELARSAEKKGLKFNLMAKPVFL